MKGALKVEKIENLTMLSICHGYRAELTRKGQWQILIALQSQCVYDVLCSVTTETLV